MSFSIFLVYTMWVLLLFQPEALIASFGAGPLRSLPTVLLPVLIGVALTKSNRQSWYGPMLLLLFTHTMVLPFVTNRGYAMDPFKVMVYFSALLVASLATIDTAPKASTLITMFLFHFIWWGIHGLPRGKVPWHSEFGNQDAFGPLMVVGIGFCGFYALREAEKGVSKSGVAAALLCAVGLVASFARGATLAGGVVLVALSLRSKRKFAMFGSVVLIGVTIMIASATLFPKGAFWREIESSFEGFEDQTGRDRGDLWSAGWQVFLRAPLIGVGPNNFGSYAAENFQEGEASGFYADPNHLYGRHLHNIFIQVLAEQGLVGVAIFLFILVDFMRKNKNLRTKEAVECWEKAVGGRSDLVAISRGLEGAMIGYLATGFFYNQLYAPTFYSLIIITLVLHSITVPRRTPSVRTVSLRASIQSKAQPSTSRARSYSRTDSAHRIG